MNTWTIVRQSCNSHAARRNLEQADDVMFFGEDIRFLGVPLVFNKLTQASVYCLVVKMDHRVLRMRVFSYCATSACKNILQRRMALLLSSDCRIVTMAIRPYNCIFETKTH